MKALSLALLALSLAMQAASAASPDQDSSEHEFLKDLQALTFKCVVRPYSRRAEGKTEQHPPKSTCPEIRIVNAQNAVIQLEGETFTAQLVESVDSDGGDLDDLTVRDSRGNVVAQRKNVLAFDDILIAFVGGKDDFRQIEE